MLANELSPTTSAALVALALSSLPPVFDHLQYEKSGGRRPGESYHVIRCTGITNHRAYMYSYATENTNLAFCTSHGDKTAANGEQHQAYKTKFSLHSKKEATFGFAMLGVKQFFSSYASGPVLFQRSDLSLS